MVLVWDIWGGLWNPKDPRKKVSGSLMWPTFSLGPLGQPIGSSAWGQEGRCGGQDGCHGHLIDEKIWKDHRWKWEKDGQRGKRSQRCSKIFEWWLKFETGRKMNVRSRSPASWLEMDVSETFWNGVPERWWLGSGYPSLILYPAVKKEKKSLPRGWRDGRQPMIFDDFWYQGWDRSWSMEVSGSSILWWILWSGPQCGPKVLEIFHDFPTMNGHGPDISLCVTMFHWDFSWNSAVT